MEKYGTLYGTLGRELELAIEFWYGLHKDFNLLKQIIRKISPKSSLAIVNHNNIIIISTKEVSLSRLETTERTKELEDKIRQLLDKVKKYKWAIKALNDLFAYLIKNSKTAANFIRRYFQQKPEVMKELNEIMKEVIK